MKIATWNVNSMKVRLPHVLEWLSAADPDVLVLQEIKQLTEMFPQDELAAVGYHSLANGQKTYNGVASRQHEEPQDPDLELPGFDDPQRRVLAVTIDGVRVVNLYVPNGSEVGSEKYAYKLGWLRTLRDFLEAQLAKHEKLVVLGDFNIAPADEDVYDPEKWGDAILCSPARARGAGGTARPRPDRRVSQVRPARKGVQLVGLSRGRCFAATPGCAST